MESARVRKLRTSFLIQKQRECKHRTKHLPCCNLFLLCLLTFSPSTRFSPFIRLNKCQVMFLFRLSKSTLSLLQNPGENVFRTESLPQHQSRLQLCFVSLNLPSCKSCASSLGFWSSLCSAVNEFI